MAKLVLALRSHDVVDPERATLGLELCKSALRSSGLPVKVDLSGTTFTLEGSQVVSEFMRTKIYGRIVDIDFYGTTVEMNKESDDIDQVRMMSGLTKSVSRSPVVDASFDERQSSVLCGTILQSQLERNDYDQRTRTSVLTLPSKEFSVTFDSANSEIERWDDSVLSWNGNLSIKFSPRSCSPRGAARVMEYFISCAKRIHAFKMTTSSHASDGVKVLIESFPLLAREMNNLEHLDLSVPWLDCGPSLDAIIESGTSLVVLKLSVNPFDSTIAKLMNVLEKNRPTLKKLVIKDCNLDDQDLAEILQAYRRSKSKSAPVLQSVKFEGKFKDESVEAMLQTHLPNLESLTMGLSADVSSDCVQALKDKFGRKLSVIGPFTNKQDSSQGALAEEAIRFSRIGISYDDDDEDDDEEDEGAFSQEM